MRFATTKTRGGLSEKPRFVLPRSQVGSLGFALAQHSVAANWAWPRADQGDYCVVVSIALVTWSGVFQGILIQGLLGSSESFSKDAPRSEKDQCGD
jgi:hypothetical protein